MLYRYFYTAFVILIFYYIVSIPPSVLTIKSTFSSAPVLAFTYMIKSLLEKQGKKVGLIGTIQNIIDKEVLPAKNTTPDAYELQSLFSLMF